MTKNIMGEKIQRLRKYYGFSREEMANKLSPDARYIYYIERGRFTPSDAMLFKLADALKTTIDCLKDDDDKIVD